MTGERAIAFFLRLYVCVIFAFVFALVISAGIPGAGPGAVQ